MKVKLTCVVKGSNPFRVETVAQWVECTRLWQDLKSLRFKSAPIQAFILTSGIV